MLAENPDVAPILFDAFKASKGRLPRAARHRQGSDPRRRDQHQARRNRRRSVPFGVEPNRMAIETVVGYARDQASSRSLQRLMRCSPLERPIGPDARDHVCRGRRGWTVKAG